MGSSASLSTVLLLALTIHLSIGCQVPWELQTKTLLPGGVIGFKNVTTIGQQETLSWSWNGHNQDLWEINMLHSFQTVQHIEGKVTYRKVVHNEKKVVTLEWVINGSDISSMSNNKQIFSKPWTLSVCNVLDVDFTSDKTGAWEFKIGDFTLKRVPEEIEENNYRSRQRRDEDFDYGEVMNVTQQRGPMDYIYDYFFGEDDPASGRAPGIFIQMRNWVKDVACRMIGFCDEKCPPDPTRPPVLVMPPPPVPEIPPADPDTESVTEDNYDNDVMNSSI